MKPAKSERDQKFLVDGKETFFPKGSTILKCDCGHEKPMKRTTMTEIPKPQKKIEVVEEGINPLAVYDHKCSKCGFEKAQMISKGIWYSDEDEVIEFVCGKCGFHEKMKGQKIT